MTKQEYMAASLPYGLKLMQLRKHYSTPQKDRVVTLDGIADICGLLPSVIYNNEAINFYTVFYRVDESTSGSDSDIQFIPIVRPLESLTKECVQKDYNNGKPFVPIVELAKLLYERISIAESFKLIEDRVYFESISDNQFWYSKEMKCFCTMFENADIPVHNQLQLFQQLLKWHFDLFGGIESGEAIDVNTLDINPYQ